MELEFGEEPIIEEFDEIKYEAFKKMEKNKKTYKAFYFNCLDCDNEGYLLNKNQLMCPKCGAPFGLRGIGELEPKKDYIPPMPQFKKDITTGIRKEVSQAFKHLIEEDVVTDMEED